MKQTQVLIVVLVSALTACTSLTKQGEEQYAKGEFAAAASLYERALAKDSKDVAAAEGLAHARQHLIEDRLIEVRQQRLSDNFQESLDRLSSILADETRWNIAPAGPAFATQTEETEELFAWFGRQIRADLDGGKFLKAKLYADKYHSVFGVGPLSYRNLQLSSQISTRGNLHCAQLRKAAQGPFSAEFVRRYCMAWGQNDGSSAPGATAKAEALGIPGFGEIQLVGHVENLPPEALSTLADSLLQGLKTTPFYLAGGPALKVNLVGRFDSTYSETPFMAVHSYQVQVPYQVQVTVPYQENVTVPYKEYETVSEMKTVYDPISGKLKQEPETHEQLVTHYRTESQTRYRDEWETRYRDETRTLSYPATEFHLNYRLASTLDLNIDKVQHQIPLNDELSLTDTFHDTSNPSIGLSAKEKVAPTSVSWLAKAFQTTNSQLADKVTAAWDAKYCQIPKDMLERTQTESIMKCLRGTRRDHEFVENWFASRFGLSYAQVQQAIGIFR